MILPNTKRNITTATEMKTMLFLRFSSFRVVGKERVLYNIGTSV